MQGAPGRVALLDQLHRFLNHLLLVPCQGRSVRNSVLYEVRLPPCVDGVLLLKSVVEHFGQLGEELVALGVEVLFDDRKERPGVMFNDMELIGIPHSIVIGERNLDNQQVEYKNRRTGEKQLLDISAAKDFVAAL